jgi:hypothetical protein
MVMMHGVLLTPSSVLIPVSAMANPPHMIKSALSDVFIALVETNGVPTTQQWGISRSRENNNSDCENNHVRSGTSAVLML